MPSSRLVTSAMSRAVRSRIVSNQSVRSLSLGKSSLSCSCCFGGTGFCMTHTRDISTTPSNPLSSLYKDIKAFKSLTSEEIFENDPYVRSILKNNQDWIKRKTTKDPEYFTKLSRPQTPKYLYFGCSDSRVPANETLGLGAGDVFVQRNVGNLVPGNDLNALSVLEYAVGFLGVTDIIVTGHYGCGAIRAATSRQDLGMLENWLRQIRDVYRLHQSYLDAIEDDEQRQNALVELNVIEQCLNIYKTGIVQRKRIQTKNQLLKNVPKNLTDSHDTDLDSCAFNENDVYPRIHGMVFNINTGELKKIPIDFKKRIGPLDHIYGLYTRANPIEN